jgi:cytochrome oxidase assembly protein ShyY1
MRTALQRGRTGAVRSRWLPVVALLAVIALTASLGQWQRHRAAEKDALQAQRDAARAAAPVTPSGSMPDLAALDGRRVALAGRFEDPHTVFLDNRTRNGVAGFHVLTPMRLAEGDAWVMVLRGWVARDAVDRTRVPTLPALGGAVRIEGFAQRALAQPMVLAKQPEPSAADRIWQHYDPDTFRRWSRLQVVDGVLRQISETPDGLARDWVEPGSGADKHRAYAFQWFAMAGAALVGVGVFLARTGRRP